MAVGVGKRMLIRRTDPARPAPQPLCPFRIDRPHPDETGFITSCFEHGADCFFDDWVVVTSGRLLQRVPPGLIAQECLAFTPWAHQRAGGDPLLEAVSSPSA